MFSAKSPTKWGVQIAGMIFQTRSRKRTVIYNQYIFKPVKVQVLTITYYKCSIKIVISEQ